MLKNYIDPTEKKEADRKLPRLMTEGLLLGGSGLGILALIFEIAADAFSVAAYQTLLAIHGAEGYHDIAIMAFIVLSVFLFLGIVPAYKAGAYLKPNSGGSGPLVEAIGPPRMRWLSWIGTSLFFLDAVLTIIISSISAADVTMLIYPELAEYRIVLAEVYAFFIMAVLVAVGPKRAVPLFLIGGGAFTLFTIGALSIVSMTALGNPDWAFLTGGIVTRLETSGVVEHVIRASETLPAIGSVVFFQLFFRSMSSAMLGFSGYEVIPASGKHAAKPKWKVINTALTLAAIFLIGTGVMQLFAARQWNIPATEGYSTLLIEYEIMAIQAFGDGIEEDDIIITEQDRLNAQEQYDLSYAHGSDSHGATDTHSDDSHGEAIILSEGEQVEQIAYDLALIRAIDNATQGVGISFLTLAGVLLAIILLLAQGGGYVGGAAVASNAARLGRLPQFFENDRIGIAVIWGFAAVMIPIIREVVIVESYYAFGFVSAFMITSTTVFFVRDDILIERGIKPGSSEAKSLKFAGARGMFASYFMGAVLVTQKTDALVVIIISGILITLFQWVVANGGFRLEPPVIASPAPVPGNLRPAYSSGNQRARNKARQRGMADTITDAWNDSVFVKFNVEPERIQRVVSHLYNIPMEMFAHDDEHHGERFEEPSAELIDTYNWAYQCRDKIIADVEKYSHYGIFTFVEKYHANWVSYEHGRDPATVQRAMLQILFPLTDPEEIWEQYHSFKWKQMPEPIWQFSRERYRWAKAQWPNLSDRITTIWTLQDFNLIPDEVDVETIIAVTNDLKMRKVEIHTHGPEDNEIQNDDDDNNDDK